MRKEQPENSVNITQTTMEVILGIDQPEQFSSHTCLPAFLHFLRQEGSENRIVIFFLVSLQSLSVADAFEGFKQMPQFRGIYYLNIYFRYLGRLYPGKISHTILVYHTRVAINSRRGKPNKKKGKEKRLEKKTFT